MSENLGNSVNRIPITKSISCTWTIGPMCNQLRGLYNHFLENCSYIGPNRLRHKLNLLEILARSPQIEYLIFLSSFFTTRVSTSTINTPGYQSCWGAGYLVEF
ncbi:hypothetical protein GDO81_012991 [Engystomops pustulosus]|uniref:Maturase K n=1 Tax=Engystomops pustulosus TaxID=76066 RepID=A0AAV7B433_ENGPU|nr:hypothetical protein GDO81_012991 [Engystomops pustulosus]